MSLVFKRGPLCNAYFEDFTLEQLVIECPICLKCVPSVRCMGGSHPRKPPSGTDLNLSGTNDEEEESDDGVSVAIRRLIGSTPPRSNRKDTAISVSGTDSTTSTATTPINKLKIAETSAERRHLISLSINEVVALFQNLGLPDDCEPVIRRERITGRALNEITTEEEIKELQLPLSSVKARVLLRALDDVHQDGGVPSDLLLALQHQPPLQEHQQQSFSSPLLSSFLFATTPSSGTSTPSVLSPSFSAHPTPAAVAVAAALNATPSREEVDDDEGDDDEEDGVDDIGLFSPAAKATSDIAPAATPATPPANADASSLSSWLPIPWDWLSSPDATANNSSGTTGTGAAARAAVIAAPPMKFVIVPGTDVTTVIGIRDALNRLVRFLEDPLHPSTISSVSEESNIRTIFDILDAIPKYIGCDEGGSKGRMKALGAHEARLIGNLKKLLDLLLEIYAAEPTYPVTAIGATPIIVKAFIAIQKMMRYKETDAQTSCHDNIEDFGKNGTCEVLVAVLKKYLEVQPVPVEVQLQGEVVDRIPAVLSECCKTISFITSDDENRVAYGDVEGSFDVLVDVLQRARGGAADAAVAEACCKAVINVTVNDDNRVAFGAVEGSCEALVGVLRAHGTRDANVAEICCKAVINMTVHDHVDIKVKYGATQGSMDVLVDVLKAHGATNATLAATCCRAIKGITVHSTYNKAKYGAVPGSMEVLVAVLQAHCATNAAVAEACCGVVWSITYKCDVNRLRYGETPGSLEVLVDVLRAHGLKDTSVAESCCKAIVNITFDETDLTKRFAAVPGSVETLMEVLKIHGRTHAAVAEACYKAVTNITVHEIDTKVVAGTMDEFVGVLLAHGRTNAAVAESCCRAIVNITAHNAYDKAKYAQVDGMTGALVDDVLEAHGRSIVSLAEACCWAIGNICKEDPDYRKKFGKTTIFSALLGVLTAYGKEDTLENKAALERCCYAIAFLCKDNDANKAKFQALNAIQVITDDVTILQSADNKYLRDARKALRPKSENAEEDEKEKKNPRKDGDDAKISSNFAR